MTRALLVIDVQNEYFDGKLPITHPSTAFDNILSTMDFAASVHMPIIVVQHSAKAPDSPVFCRDTPSWELHAEIAGRPRDAYIEKRFPGSFTQTALEECLRTRGIDTVTISGFMTHMCCDTTARQAFHRGFKVEFLNDATGTLSLSNAGGEVSAPDLHRAVLAVQQSRFSAVMSSKMWKETVAAAATLSQRP